MVMPNPYNQYRQTQVQTAPPEQLILMLYDGALRFLHQAESQLQDKNMEGANSSLVRVQDIISELQLSVNDQAGEIAQQLNLLYDYLYRRAIEANLRKDAEIIKEIDGLIRNLRSTWAEAILLSRQQRAGMSNGRY